MRFGFCFICVFAVLINKVRLHVIVEAVIGGSVVLPCSSAEHDLKLQDIAVHWRQNGSIYVYDIVKGKDAMAEQEPRYKNRTETFPEEYVRGNFSIKLNSLTHADAGKYICLITPSDEQKTVELIINESTGGDSVEISWPFFWVCIVIVVSLSVFMVGLIIYLF